MGKPTAPPPPTLHHPSSATATRRHCTCPARISLRCAIALLLGAAVFVSALFCLPLFHARRSEFVTDAADVLAADIQATFTLQMPVSRLVSHIGRLENDILEEIEVPNSKVNIVSMRPLATTNTTNVVFAVLPYLSSTTISSPALSLLRSCLIDLVLREVNLSLTPSIFGKPTSFEVLKFPGGLTVIPTQSAAIWERTEILFNLTLNSSINQTQMHLQKLKDQLKFGLALRYYENVYVQLTNLNGSTVAPPVTIQASVLSDYGSRDLLPDRLKQLAQVITGSHAENFGLNHSIFGKVKQVELSSYLRDTLSTSSPSPSPSPSLPPVLPPCSSPSRHPYSPYAPAPSPQRQKPPCLYCDGYSPTGSPLPSPALSNSPAPSVSHIAHPCLSSSPPKASPAYPPTSTDNAPSSAIPPQYKHLGPFSGLAPAFSLLSPEVLYSSRPLQDKGIDKSPSPVHTLSMISANEAPYRGQWLICLLVGLLLL